MDYNIISTPLQLLKGEILGTTYNGTIPKGTGDSMGESDRDTYITITSNARATADPSFYSNLTKVGDYNFVVWINIDRFSDNRVIMATDADIPTNIQEEYFELATGEMATVVYKRTSTGNGISGITGSFVKGISSLVLQKVCTDGTNFQEEVYLGIS